VVVARRVFPSFVSVVLAWAVSFAILAPRAFSAGQDELNRQLMLAAEKGNLRSAEEALVGGADPNARVPGTWLNYTPLHQAVSGGHREIAELLLEHGANPYLEDENNDAVLVFARHDKNGPAMLRLLLDWKVPIDSKNSLGVTALMRSMATPGDEKGAALLLEFGADPNLRMEGGITPLMSAAGHPDAKQAVVLIQGGADINAQDDEGNTPLMHVLDSAYTACAKPLLEAGANVNLPNKAGQTPLMLALGSEEGIDRLLLEHGADPNAVTENGTTLLMLAALRGSPDTVRLLLSRKVDARARDRDGQTAVHYAAGATPYYSDAKEMAATRAKPGAIINLLVGAGADLKAVDVKGRSALHLAAMTGYVETVRLLLEKQFDPNQEINDGRTPLHLAMDGRDVYSQDAGEKFRLLLASGAAPDAVDKEGRAPLYSAVEMMNRDFTLRLIEKGAFVDRLAKNDLTPLILAARSFHDHYVPPENYAAIVVALAAKTKVPDARDGLGMTPLMWAAASDVPAAVEALLAQHADLNARARDGRTALMWAASANAGKTIKALLEKGADKSAKDNAGRTASGWARWMGQSRALDLLGDEAP